MLFSGRSFRRLPTVIKGFIVPVGPNKSASFSGRVLRNMFGPDKWPRLSVVARYFVLGAGVATIGFASYRYVGVETREERVRLSLLALFTTGIGYIGAKYIRVAHCKSDSTKGDLLDEKLKDIHLKVVEVQKDLQKTLDEKAEELWNLAKEKYISQAVKEAFELVKEIINNLRDFGDFDTEDFSTPLPILLALVRKGQDSLEREFLANLPKESEKEFAERFHLHKRIAEFALKIYDASLAKDVKKQVEILGIKEEKDIVFSYLMDKEDAHCPKFMIFLDHETKNVILAIRGTFCLTDVIIDIICDEEEFLDGYAHRGMMRGACKILSECQEVLKETLETHPEYNLVITGHSLGAGTAQLLAMTFLHDKKQKYIPNCTKNVSCVALAPPPIYRSSKALPTKVIDAIDIYINRQDGVPRMSLASIAKLVAVLRAVDKIQMSPYEQLMVIAGSSDEKAVSNLALVEKTLGEIRQDRFPYLDHPTGRINYLYPAEPSLESFLVARADGKAFSHELILLERMVIDHLENFYREAFQKTNINNVKSKETK